MIKVEFHPKDYPHITVKAKVWTIGDLPAVCIEEVFDWNGNEVTERLLEDWRCEALELAEKQK